MLTLWRFLMKSKVLSLISSSVIGLSVLVMQGHANSISINDRESLKAFRLFNMSQRYQMPVRYEHLKKLQAAKHRAARREARQPTGKKTCDFSRNFRDL